MKKRVLLPAKFAAPVFLGLFAAACVDQQPAGPRSDAVSTPAPTFSVQASQTTPTDQHVVVMTAGIPGAFAAQVEALGGTVAATYPEIGVAVTIGLSNVAAATLARAPGVAGVDRDLEVQWIPSPDQLSVETVQAPSDQTDQSGARFFPRFQWNLRQIQANTAWLTTNQGSGTRVAILDTGIDPGHAEFIGKIDLTNSRSLLTSSPPACGPTDATDILDRNFHGSFVAGIVATDGFRMASVAPDARLIAVKVLNCRGFGSFAGVIGGIVHAVTVGADVINMSLGAYFPKNLPGAGQLVAALNRATNFANSHGVLVVAAAGNGGVDLDKDQNFTFVPAQSANVISVGATGPFRQTNFDQLAFYTNFGVSGVSVMAPGGNFQTGGFIQDGILSVCSHFSIVFRICATGTFYLIGGDGTSFSSPHAAGTAAVVKSQFPGMDPAQLQHCLYKGADDLGKPGVDDQYSHGRINVVGAAQC